MELLRFSAFWYGTILFASVLSVQPHKGMMKIHNLCKFCDVRPTNCSGTGWCNTGCEISSICQHDDEICVSIWRKEDDNATIETLCHNRTLKLYGLALDDYNNTKCEMKERKGMGSKFFICSCSDEECNDHMNFSPRADGV